MDPSLKLSDNVMRFIVVPQQVTTLKVTYSSLTGSCGSLSYRNGDWEGITEGILIQGHINDILGGVEK